MLKIKSKLLHAPNVLSCLNHNGKKLIELCKISDLKIVNGRIGTDKSFGNYTCHTTKGQSTIDYVVMSMELFPKTMDFYIDTLDRCMSDVHCPVCLIFSSDKNIVTHHNEVENVTADNGNYNIKNNVTCKWNEQLREQYTLAFNIEEIENFIKNLKIYCTKYPTLHKI